MDSNEIKETIIIDFYVEGCPPDANSVTLKAGTDYVLISELGNHCDIVTYSWSVFDGKPNQTGKKAFVNYDNHGIHNVMLTVTSRHPPGLGSCIADGTRTKQGYVKVVR